MKISTLGLRSCTAKVYQKRESPQVSPGAPLLCGNSQPLVAETSYFFLVFNLCERLWRRSNAAGQRVERHKTRLNRFFFQDDFAVELRHPGILCGLLRHIRIAGPQFLFTGCLRNTL